MKKEIKNNSHAVPKENIRIMIIGLSIIVLGFIFMIGGGSDDPNVFNYKMFSFSRLTLSPILIIIGFGVEIYAIMKRPKEKTEDE
ncbi:MAG: DUF3098 domain-containing protein [Bacteroidales bacterium]